MFRIGCSVLLIIVSLTTTQCDEHCPKEEHLSKGLATSFIKFLDFVFDFVVQAFFGLDKFSDDDDDDDEFKKLSYNGFQLLKMWPRTDDDVDHIRTIGEQSRVQIWLPVMKNASTDVIIPPDAVTAIKDELKEYGVEYATINKNIQQLIREQGVELNSNETQKLKDNKEKKFSWTHYPSYDEILDYMDYLQVAFPKLVKIITIGNTYEGKEMKLIQISSGRFNDGSTKPAMWIDGGIHAREWISVAVALYIAKQLTENSKNHQILLNDMDWYILPVANPDGYVYSHTTDRLWKKSRSIDSELMNRYSYLWKDEECKGVDLSRNWDFRWNEDSSSSACLDTYAGSVPFSEPETRAMSKFLKDHQKEIVVYITLHSYSQKWLMPWNSNNLKTQDYADLLYVGRKAVEALKKTHGIQYDLVTKNENMYAISGGFSDDWAKNKLGIKYSYTVELRDKGTYGFLLPANQILPTGKEIFTGIKTLTRSILNDMVNKNVKYK